MDKRSFCNISKAKKKKRMCISLHVCAQESHWVCVRSGKSTFVTFKCTKALPRHHYAFNLTVQQSVWSCCPRSHLRLHPHWLFPRYARLPFGFKTEWKPQSLSWLHPVFCTWHLVRDWLTCAAQEARMLSHSRMEKVLNHVVWLRTLSEVYRSFTPVNRPRIPRQRGGHLGSSQCSHFFHIRFSDSCKCH